VNNDNEYIRKSSCGLVTSTCPIRSQQVRSESPMKTQEWQDWRRGGKEQIRTLKDDAGERR
jgi:hypothetical protein